MHARRVTLVVTLAAGVTILGSPLPAGADGTGDAWHRVEKIGAEANSPGGTGDAVTGRRRRSGSAPCRYELLSPAEQEIAEHMAADGWSEATKGDGPGRWLRKICGQDATSPGTATVIWVPQRTDPEVLAERALREADLPLPGIATSPPANQPQLVNLPTWLAVDPSGWNPVSVSASAGAVTVSTTAKPEKVVWSVGTGDEVTCTGPGNRYDPARPASEQHPDCSYTYRRPGTFQLTATVVWHVTWSAVGIPGGGDLGFARRSVTVPVQVAEIQSLNRFPQQGG
ncbi:MAG: hypothetical protein AB1679_00080 [Actinomycetota bacterium]